MFTRNHNNREIDSVQSSQMSLPLWEPCILSLLSLGTLYIISIICGKPVYYLYYLWEPRILSLLSVGNLYIISIICVNPLYYLYYLWEHCILSLIWGNPVYYLNYRLEPCILSLLSVGYLFTISIICGNPV